MSDTTEAQDIVINEVDRLNISNLQLKAMYATATTGRLRAELQNQLNEEHETVRRFNAAVAELGVKYKFDPARYTMDPSTGKLLPVETR